MPVHPASRTAADVAKGRVGRDAVALNDGTRQAAEGDVVIGVKDVKLGQLATPGRREYMKVVNDPENECRILKEMDR